MRKPPLPSSRTIAGALLTLLTLASAPSETRAGCHLPPGAPAAAAAGLDHLAELGALADAPGPRPPSPCDGLRCSEDPAPGPIPGGVGVDRLEHWGRLAAAVLEDRSSRSHPIPRSGPLRPSHRGHAPFHPPRV